MITTSAPAAANARAVASPMPWLPPMTYTCCPSEGHGSASVIENYGLDKHLTETESLVKLLCWRHDQEAAAPNRPHTGRRRNEAARDAILYATVGLLRTAGWTH